MWEALEGQATAAVCVALNDGAEGTSCSEGAVEGLDQGGIVLVLLLAGEHAAVLYT